ncbi:MAG: Zn-dependent oxidoreductase [Synergistetes bacterium]|nr:MAG: Alcohol dehydrogenase GroES domain protein [bacterium 42_11]MBC7332551.1 Zn-dependent oxidoreductase [Synergistota bacterium]MDK2871410.1 hypothetical protein [bacterium]
MKAIVVVKPNLLLIEDRPFPKIEADNQVLVRVKAGGICGSDLHIYRGESPVATYPRVIGHEIVGEVIETGPAVNKVKKGDRVAVEPVFSCGQCYPCKTGRPNVCEKLEVFGVHRDGGFQEYIVIPETNLHVFSKEIEWNDAVIIEPFTIAAEVAERGFVMREDHVFIIGAGPIGLCILQYLKVVFEVKCGICDVIEERLKRAEEIGADFVVNVSNSDLEHEVYKHFPKGANVVVDAVGFPETFESALKLASSAGRIVLLGFDKRASSIPQAPITLKGLTISGSRLQAGKFPHIVELFNKRKLSGKNLVTHVFPFERVMDTFELIEKSPEKVCKVVLSF